MTNRALWAIVVTACVVALGALSSLTSLSHRPPSVQPQPPNVSAVDKKLRSMTLREQVARMFMFHVATKDPTVIANYMKTVKPGGLILMGDNIPSSDTALQELTAAVRTSDGFTPFVAIDQEGGTVRRLMDDTLPGANSLRTMPAADSEATFRERSIRLQRVGIRLNFGIVADVTNNPQSFIFQRVLGTTPENAADRVRAAVTGSRTYVFSTLKHFPGHGATNANSHVSVPTTDMSQAVWQQTARLPFQAGIEAGAEFVMFGHLRYSSVDQEPASLSATWHQILVRDMGFQGITITDDMFMLQDSGEAAYADPVANALRALQAGNTMLLYVTNNGPANKTALDPNLLIDAIVRAVESGQLPRSVVEQNVRKILQLQQPA